MNVETLKDIRNCISRAIEAHEELLPPKSNEVANAWIDLAAEKLNQGIAQRRTK